MQGSKAYQIFLSELARYVADSRYSIDCENPPEVAQLREIATGFHTVKGGAGFFGLSKIAESAAAIETIALQANRGVEAIFELQSQLALFRAAAKQLLPDGGKDG